MSPGTVQKDARCVTTCTGTSSTTKAGTTRAVDTSVITSHLVLVVVRLSEKRACWTMHPPDINTLKYVGMCYEGEHAFTKNEKEKVLESLEDNE